MTPMILKVSLLYFLLWSQLHNLIGNPNKTLMQTKANCPGYSVVHKKKKKKNFLNICLQSFVNHWLLKGCTVVK